MNWQQLKSKIGDLVDFQDDEGGLVCPVCGKQLTKAAWETFICSWQFQSAADAGPACPYCYTEFEEFFE